MLAIQTIGKEAVLCVRVTSADPGVGFAGHGFAGHGFARSGFAGSALISMLKGFGFANSCLSAVGGGDRMVAWRGRSGSSMKGPCTT